MPDEISASLEAVVRRFRATLARIGGRYGLLSTDLDELIQEIRIALWRARGDAVQIQSLTASYVYRTAATAALMILRRRRGRGARTKEVTGVAEEREFPDPNPSPESAVVRSELTDQIALALGELDASRALAVRLHLTGYRLNDIVELTGWSVGRARALLYRGLADLRVELARRGVGPEALA